ncbi:hypothetical protein [Halomarina litorea]|uniref:hypothetical protein n=1 Tax=Halomarina litorea TaxID=2961595 RepID=UPI0020C3EAA4|nr:hypothetical protein [Halomarina sp. BCD28]
MSRSDKVEWSDGESRPAVVERAASVAADSGAALRIEPRSLAASDVRVDVTDGRPDALRVRPSAECAWAGLRRSPVEVGATLLAALPTEEVGFDPVATEVLPLESPGMEGYARFAFASPHCVLTNTTLGPVDFASFGADHPPRERALRLRLVVDLVDGEGLPMEGDAVTTDWVIRVGEDDGSATFLDC